MPWRVTEVSNERMRFVVRLEAGERMTDLCHEFGISRKTGYKFWNRYREGGPEALGDYSRRPHRHPNRTAEEICELVLRARKERPTWGPKKLRVFLREEHPGVPIPAASTIGELLDRAGLVKPRRRRRRCSPTPTDQLTQAQAPNDVWCADFKGQFKTKDGRYCYPITITDQYSRYIIACDARENTRTDGAYATFADVFATYGLPRVLRTDNGTPFASSGLAGLTRLSVWWLRLGIRPERIEPGHPEQNGRHERMHLTLKQEATRPPGANLLHQQEKLDVFRCRFNDERPHEALAMKRPAEVYRNSDRSYPDLLAQVEYPLHDRSCRVYDCGCISLNNQRFYVSTALVGERVGLREIEDKRWLLTFLDIDLGVIDESEQSFEPKQQEAA